MTKPTNISEVLDELLESHDRRPSFEPDHKDAAKAQFKRIIEEALPEKKEYLAQTTEGEANIDGYNQALDDVRQQLERIVG